jgi:CRISPR-associated protein Cmr2
MMKSYLYVLSIGPVQDFIAAARRTRDLWLGSHLLSEISKAAAKRIDDEGGRLIFPNLKKEKLEPSSSPDAPNVANIILAELKLPDQEDPSHLNKRAQAAAQDEWEQYAKGAKHLVENLSEVFVDDNIWKEQVVGVLEFYSAWVPMPERKEDYQKARNRLMGLLAGRKSTRNFFQAKGHAQIPKSSLDGARESVIQKDSNIPKELALKMRLQAGEELCAIGLTKRLGGKRAEEMANGEKKVLEAFPSVVRVALDPWIRGLRQSGDDAIEILDEIIEICKSNGNIAAGTGEHYADFPFDGQVLHLSRITSMMKVPEKRPDHRKGWKLYLSPQDRNDLQKIKVLVEQLQKKNDSESGTKYFGLGEPERYYAILIADGDRMGKVISTRIDKDEHLSFSAKLSEFADKARKIVKKHNGCMVYSGGDDVLAFLPLDCCLQTARELHDYFGDLLKDFKVKDDGDIIDSKGKSPTLSVGIAIGHSMEPLEDLLKFGRDAEKGAKGGKSIDDERDGLSIHLYPRSGSSIKIREKWRPEGKDGLDERLLMWAEMHCNDELPDSAGYDMHELAEDYKKWDISSEEKKKERSDLIDAYSMKFLKKAEMQCHEDLSDSPHSDARDSHELAEYCFKNWDVSSVEKKKKLEILIAADVLRLLKRKKARSESEEVLKREKIERLRKGVDSYEAAIRLADEIIMARRLANAMRQAKGNICAKPKTKEVA